ncbi:MAG: hypothetical protein WA005_13270, partial [Candidatus Binataceae bacterium]
AADRGGNLGLIRRRERPVGGTANANSYQFIGRENDGTGLYFYRARHYSPTVQRFIAPWRRRQRSLAGVRLLAGAGG